MGYLQGRSSMHLNYKTPKALLPTPFCRAVSHTRHSLGTDDYRDHRRYYRYGACQTTVSSWSKKSKDGPDRLMSSPLPLATTSVYRRRARSLPSRSISCRNGEPSGQVARVARVFQCVSTRRSALAPVLLALKSILPLPSFPKRLMDEAPSPSTLNTIRLFLPWS